jgi:hypothetical protein
LGGQFLWPGTKTLRNSEQALPNALKQNGWISHCKDCTSRNAPTVQSTDHRWQKFRLFFHFVTDRFYPAKMSLGQNLERERPYGKIVRQSAQRGTDVPDRGAIAPTKGMFF